MRRLALSLVVVVVAGAAPALTSPAAATFSGRNGRIVYHEQDGNSDLELYSIKADGTGRRKLTNNSVTDARPTWSPDGTKIALVRSSTPGDSCCPVLHGDVWVMNGDGSGARRLSHLDGVVDSPTWSPDGSRLAFKVGNDRLVILPVTGGAPRTVFADADWYVQNVAWSPTAATLVFSAYSTSRRSMDLWLMRADGSRLRRLTTHDGADEKWPDWSPDGRSIVYTQNLRGSFRIRIIRADGTGATLLPQSGAVDARFSPDGTRLVYYTCTAECGLHTSRPDGSDARTVPNNAGAGPTWQPLR